MIEAKAQPRVRDLTAAPRRIPIEDDGAGVYDLILALWAVFNPKEEPKDFELGSEWFEAMADRAPAGLRDEIQALGGPYCGVWLAVAGLAASAPHPHDAGRVIKWLSSIDPQRLRRWILGYVSHFRNSGLIDQAADGDLGALDALLEDELGEEDRARLLDVLAIDPEDLRDRLVQALTVFRSEVYGPEEEGFAEAVGRAAAARRAIANHDDAKSVIEQVTNGLDYEIPLGVTRVILIPSVVLRPLSLIDQFRDTLLVFYAVADEFLDSDPEAPPSWMVRTYKALSDERRLRILRRLAEGETTLDELTELLGLSKSTVHHHISVLRGAGLVRVHLGKDKKHHETKSYALREQPLVNAADFLDSYVRTGSPASRGEAG
jgi:DNA-binding transcriptional ArsR family regulator